MQPENTCRACKRRLDKCDCLYLDGPWVLKRGEKDLTYIGDEPRKIRERLTKIMDPKYEVEKADQAKTPVVETFWIYKDRDSVPAYVVGRVYNCTCKGYLYTGQCKHITMVQKEAL